ncbi:MAG: redoxin family protein [Candidatus Peribacteraceae bacterium]|jgi:thiol-disulfide isomerase/thioredoxin
MAISSLPRLARAPEFRDLGPWHNGLPVTLKELRGKVVLVDFWTYTCVNCLRTLPFLRRYWSAYGGTSFVMIGIHAPEFQFERDERAVAEALRRLRVTWPVAQDNAYGTWQAFANHYWPAKYLIDAEGYIRSLHTGEGGYQQTENEICSLLEEAGVPLRDRPPAVHHEPMRSLHNQTPETYLNSRSWHAFAGAPPLPPGGPFAYAPPSLPSLHRYALGGTWELVDDERQVLRSTEGEMRLCFLGSEANVVLQREEGSGPAEATVSVDGTDVSVCRVDHGDMYPLFSGAYGEHALRIRFRGEGVAAYAFTFG